MASPSVTYTFSNSTTADATQVNQNFTDLINALTDGTKSLSIDALTCAGTTTLNGAVNIGNSSSDDITVTGSLASSLPIKTTATYDIGNSAIGLRYGYFGSSGGSYTARVAAAAGYAASRQYTIPDAGASADFVMSAGTKTIAGDTTFSGALTGATVSGNELLAIGTSTIASSSTYNGLPLDGISHVIVNTVSNNVVINGVTGGTTVGQLVFFSKTASPNNLVVNHNGGTNQQIRCPGGVNLTISSHGGLVLMYLETNVWIVVATTN